jgi:hypothetical protein
MSSTAALDNVTEVRRVFPRWSISVPVGFSETFVADDEYWHAWDRDRSVSLTSVVIDDLDGRPVSVRRILKQVTPPAGERLRMPPGRDGWVVVVTPPKPTRASRAITGIFVVKGRALLATITADDPEWAWATWCSIRFESVPAARRHVPRDRPWTTR